MEGKSRKKRLSKVLKILNLTDKYPGGITCSDMNRITKNSLLDEQPKSEYNYTAREFNLTVGHEHRSSSRQKGKKSKYLQKMEQSAEKNVMEVSPMDVIIAVYLCCDGICKQDLVSHMWNCRLSVPLIIQDNVLPKYPWETEVNEEHCVREGRLVKEAVTCIAFIRLGEVNVSKSALINSVINGMIDVGWYFPTPKTEAKHHDCFQDAVMFLNLHGNASELPSQLVLLSKLAHTITVVFVCTVSELKRCKTIFKLYVGRGNTFLILLADPHIKTVDIEAIDNVLEFLEANDSQVEFAEVHTNSKANLIKETRSKLSRLSRGKFVRLEDILTPYQNRKQIHLPLQGDPWIAWAKADKERLRPSNRRRNETIDSYVADRLKIMNKCRQQQREILKKKGNNMLLQIFLKSISTDNDRKRKLFLRWLKYELDDLSREELRPVDKRYQQIINKLASVKGQITGIHKFELEKLDKEVASISFGLEHILREMGQTYEALISMRYPVHLRKYNLPYLAAKILIDGYPIELLDGNVNSVPLCWVKAVLNAMEHAFKHKSSVEDIRIKVISTLGIQSSGKSTMLNVLFGCQYAVSAGRCTRGAYCQVIEVHQDCREELGTYLIMAIDTEGLRAPEFLDGNQMVKHDNELTTFVIGVADITILNLFGENTTYLDEILPISVHAFLRMEMATSFKPKCVIIYQNVIKEDVGKLLKQGIILEDKLNKMTQLVSKVERVEIKSFKDIINFDVGRDSHYVSALFEGIQPMAPISKRHSEELNAFKRTLLMNDDRVQKSLYSFVRHLDNIWSNIKKDDFVYQFRNTIETEARRKLDDFWCKANCSFRQPINKMVETSYVKLQNCTDSEQLNDLVKTLEKKLMGAIDTEYHTQKCAFQHFLDKADTLMKETMMRWSTDMEKRFCDLRTDLVKETSEKLQEFEQFKKQKFSLRQRMQGLERTLRAEVKKLVSDVKSTERILDSKIDIFSFFEKYWKDWTSNLIRDNPRHEVSINIEADALEAIKRSFPNGQDSLTKYLAKKAIGRYSRCDYDVNEIAASSLNAQHVFDSSKYMDCIQDLDEDLFDLVDTKLTERGQVVRPYTSVDIYELVRLVKQTLKSKQNTTKTNVKHDVYIAVLTCGHAINILTKFHEEYESQNNLENVLESLKKHYFETFMLHWNETARLSLLANKCQEIFKVSILETMTRSFTGNIVIGMENDSFIRREKSWTMLTLLIDTARTESFDDFTTFIRRPEKSIYRYISNIVDNYFNQDVNPLYRMFRSALNDIIQNVSLILEDSFASENNSFETWLKTLQENANEIIILENIDRLNDLGKNKDIDLELLHEKLKIDLEETKRMIFSDMHTYLTTNMTLFKTKVVEQIMKTIIGCTESCPFCGAICMVASAGHKTDHYTTLHRPQGCNRWHYKDTKVLLTETCPMSVASENKQFRYMHNDEEKYCLYKEYRTIYPTWKISKDETGEETSFWNWFFAAHAKELAGKGLVVPEIPLAWKELDKETEIEKLQTSMQIN
ncbi:hypothetical protein ACJMK2_023728 [Sinanodonta woodiana]|uniref:VLIG-type G domain-containing protein n=1 Tax=Sinanodonta woodiana TaxID=1069815 RepID=A0ABD3T557_SINWO